MITFALFTIIMAVDQVCGIWRDETTIDKLAARRNGDRKHSPQDVEPARGCQGLRRVCGVQGYSTGFGSLHCLVPTRRGLPAIREAGDAGLDRRPLKAV